MIEEWVPNRTSAQCDAAWGAPHNQKLWDQNVVPYLDMTVKGWLWYQGENNMHGVMGNSQQGVGYGCQMPALVAEWRKHWSVTAGTTDPLAPFGVVTLAPGGDEGGKDIGGMRWSQTANYGVLPNPAMPATFLAQAYDLGEPWGHALDTCVKHWNCCERLGGSIPWKPRNMTKCPDGGEGWGQCANYCEGAGSPAATAPYMGGIHPRDKYPVGTRLAQAASVAVYGAGSGKLPFTGPTLSGCEVLPAGGGGGGGGPALRLKFNRTLLAGDAVAVQLTGLAPTARAATTSSTLRVLVDASYWCANTTLRCMKGAPPPCGGRFEWFCADAGAPNRGACGGAVECGKGALGAGAAAASPPAPQPWAELNFLPAGGAGGEALVDLTPLNGSTPLAVRYSWGNDQPSCCVGDGVMTTYPCRPGSCPLIAQHTRLPANPFIAKIVGGKCSCVSPQVCDD